MATNWFSSPDQVGGWFTYRQNQSYNMLELQDMIPAVGTGDFASPDFSSVDFFVGSSFAGVAQVGFFTDPLLYQINDPNNEYYPVVLMPVGLDISSRALIGVRPYG